MMEMGMLGEGGWSFGWGVEWMGWLGVGVEFVDVGGGWIVKRGLGGGGGGIWGGEEVVWKGVEGGGG